TAADIVCSQGASEGGRLHIIEMKEWKAKNKNDSAPLAAAIKAFSYSFMLHEMIRQSISPYNDWKLPQTDLWFMAPESYFQNFGGLEKVNCLFGALDQAVELFTRQNAGATKVAFHRKAIVLDQSVDIEDFRAGFDWEVIDLLIRNQRNAVNPEVVLLPATTEQFRKWVCNAFNKAGLLATN
ncbi:MAG TPA: hypothetical protein VFC46_10505, partial [Humisphaera sp.]|nr:hypothetical protein [Humisphaera sp.]